MYRMSSLVILFLVGSSRQGSFHHEININGHKMSPSHFGLTPELFHKMKISVTDVLAKYHITRSNDLSTRKDSRQLSPVDLDVNFISDCITGEVERFFRILGLIDSNEKNARTSLARIGQFDETPPNTIKESIIHELFAFVHKLIPIGEQITSLIKNHLYGDDYRQRGYSRMQPLLLNDMPRNSSHILRLLTYADQTESSLEAYLHCLDTTVTPFNLAHAFAKLVRYPPQITRKIVTSRLLKPIPNNPNAHDKQFSDMIAMTCRVLVENPSRDNFENCLKQVVMVNQCVQEQFDKNVAAVTLSNLRSNNQLTRNINDLNTTCEVILNTSSAMINCKNPNHRNVDIPLLSLTEKIFGKSFMTSAASRNVVRKLGNLINRSEWSSDMMQEVNNLAEIYQDAVKKEQYLLRRSRSDPRVLRDYNRHTRQLAQYTKNLSDIALNVIGHIRGITSTVEEALVQTASTALGLDLSKNFRALRRCGRYWDNLKGWVDYHFNQMMKPKPQNWQDFFGMNRTLTKSNDGNLTGNGLQRIFDLSYIFDRDWFTSMQSIARTNARRTSSTIMTLANTFLLATMFYEFILILAGAIYQTGNAEDTTTRPTHPPINVVSDDNSEYFGFGQDSMY